MVAFVLLAIFYGIRVFSLNQAYPSSEVLMGTLQTPVQWNGVEIQLLDGELVDQGDFQARYTLSEKALRSEILPEKYALYVLSITRLQQSEGQAWFKLEYAAAEDDGYHNLLSPELFRSLNPNAVPVAQMPLGETKTFLLAIGLHQSAFSVQEWDNLSINDLSLVLSVYPQKVMLRAA